ncbi:hypothetical protein ABZZ01_21835 [Streptomyces virginiae]
MINDNVAGRALLREKLLDGLRRAERALFTYLCLNPGRGSGPF